MMHPLVRKLETFGPLPDGDKEMIVRLAGSGETVASHTDIIHEGEVPAMPT